MSHAPAHRPPVELCASVFRVYSRGMQRITPSGHDPASAPTPAGFHAIGMFLIFGSCMAGFAAATLLRPGTVLDRAWALNPTAYAQLAPHGKIFGTLFVVLSAALACAGIGWFRRQRWGWRLAVTIIALQCVGDVINCLRGDLLRGVTGAAIAGALLYYLLRPSVRAAFPRAHLP